MGEKTLPVPDYMMSATKKKVIQPHRTVWMKIGTSPVLSWRDFKPRRMALIASTLSESA
jgi:hypothetical protein